MVLDKEHIEAMKDSPTLSLAVQSYIALIRAERKVEKCKASLEKWLSKLSDEDAQRYAEITTKIDAEENASAKV